MPMASNCRGRPRAAVRAAAASPVPPRRSVHQGLVEVADGQERRRALLGQRRPGPRRTSDLPRRGGRPGRSRRARAGRPSTHGQRKSGGSSFSRRAVSIASRWSSARAAQGHRRLRRPSPRSPWSRPGPARARGSGGRRPQCLVGHRPRWAGAWAKPARAKPTAQSERRLVGMTWTSRTAPPLAVLQPSSRATARRLLGKRMVGTACPSRVARRLRPLQGVAGVGQTAERGLADGDHRPGTGGPATGGPATLLRPLRPRAAGAQRSYSPAQTPRTMRLDEAGERLLPGVEDGLHRRRAQRIQVGRPEDGGGFAALGGVEGDPGVSGSSASRRWWSKQTRRAQATSRAPA